MWKIPKCPIKASKTVQQIKITQLQTQINIDALPSGIYMLKTVNGATQKIVKQ
jgi:hypothetical protein